MSKWRGWAFLSLIGCVLFLTLSLTVMVARWAIIGGLVAVVLGILGFGLYRLSAKLDR